LTGNDVGQNLLMNSIFGV